MNKHAFLALGVAVAAAGCSSGSDDAGGLSAPVPGPAAPASSASSATAEQARAFEALEAQTGRAWTWLEHTKFKTPMHLSAPRTGAPTLAAGGSVETTTHEFLARHKALFRMRDPAAELRMIRSEVDALAMTHARFRQHVRGVPVVGAEVMVHYDKSGILTSLDATYVPALDGLDVEPRFDAKTAVSIATADAVSLTKGADERALTPSNGELVVFALGDAPAKLAYEVKVRAVFGTDPAIWVTTIDAKTGEILDRYNDLQTMEGSGTGVLGDTKKIQISSSGGAYTLVDTSRGLTIQTTSSGGQQLTAEDGAGVVTSSSMTAWDNVNPGAGAAVDAHFNAGAVYDYYKKTHGRNGIDDAGGTMLSSVHYAQAYDNAFWDGASMSYGDGGQLFRPLSAALDVCGHEMTHGVTERTSALRYQGQTGALNEAMSDIFGVFVEHSVKPDDVKNWLMGELIGKSSSALRDFKAPANGNQPDHMSKYVQTQQDNGGVHINSGVVNNAAFLMSMGGTNPTSGTGPRYGIGYDKAEKVWYRVNTKYLTSASMFAQAAQGTMQAAKDLGLTDNEQNIIDCAWKATGVVQGVCANIVDPKATIPSTSPGDPSTGTTAGSGESSGTAGSATGDGSPPEDSTAPTSSKKRILVMDSSGGCSVGAARGAPGGAGSEELALIAGLVVAIAGLARGRRRRF